MFVCQIPPAPEFTSSWYDYLTFSYMNDLFKIGTIRPLEDSDIYALPDIDRCEIVVKRYRDLQRKTGTKKMTVGLLLRSNAEFVVMHYGATFLAAWTHYVIPLMMRKLLSFIQCPDPKRMYIGWWYLLGIVGPNFIRAFLDGLCLTSGRRVGNNLRSILISEIFAKSVRRVPDGAQADQSEASASSTGKIVNLMATDTEQIRMLASYSHNLVVSRPLSIILCVTALFQIVGLSAFAAIGVLVIALPISVKLTSWTRDAQKMLLVATDGRVNLINSFLQGIRIVKYFAWYESFISRTTNLRQAELSHLFQRYIVNVLLGNLTNATSITVTIVTFAFYTVVAGNELDAATAFSTIQVLNTLQSTLQFLPTYVSMAVQGKVAFDRIAEFLNQEDLEKYKGEEFVDKVAQNNTGGESQGRTMNIGVDHATLVHYDQASGSLVEGSTSSADSRFILRNITMKCTPGGLTVISGPTGAGKSSLVSGILGEMKRLAGQIHLPDPRTSLNDVFNTPSGTITAPRSRVAYIAQTAWLLNATIRENICFGLPYDPVRYTKVIRACALVRDLETLESGDQTEIGEKGINLSGGQKQRIALARAAYSNAEYILMDDPLSAVDAPTARHLYTRCILKHMSSSTRILVTHALGLVVTTHRRMDMISLRRASERLVLMRNGQIVADGTIDYVLQSSVARDFFAASGSESPLSSPEESTSEFEDAFVSGDEQIAEDFSKSKTIKKLVKQEERSKGAVAGWVYRSYLRAMGGVWVFVLYLVAYGGVIAAKVLRTWWVQRWTDGYKGDCKSGDVLNYGWGFVGSVAARSFFESPAAGILGMLSLESSSAPGRAANNGSEDTIGFLYGYLWLGLAALATFTIHSFVLISLSFRASRGFHVRILRSVLSAPLTFFESTPIGRILNRFSRDIQRLDTDVAFLSSSFFETVMTSGSILFTVAFVLPPFVLIIPFLVYMFMHVGVQFAAVSPEIQRLESVTRSPIYSLFSETLNGVSTIRAFGQEERFRRLCSSKVDANHRHFHYLWVANRWMSFRTDVLSVVVAFSTGAVALVSVGTSGSGVGASWAGFALVSSMEMVAYLWLVVRAYADMEMAMNSVERAEEYCSLPQEPPTVIKDYRPPEEWPSAGLLKATDLSIRYTTDSPLVLKKLNFEIRASEKVGIVGRTGAGKSTLSLAFFRIIPFAEGTILIDGMDISKMGLKDLRSRLTIIPQDPVLFAGTLRQSLDPLEQNDDQEIWAALNRVHFLDSMQTSDGSDTERRESALEVEDGDGGSTCNTGQHRSSRTEITLDEPVRENGANFSLGQRQLLCLARALLRHSKVVILDEATASVDNVTDMRLQEAIRHELRDSTLLVIAHRLRTVIDFDRIMVLDHGEIVEFGHPWQLISHDHSPTNKFRAGLFQQQGESLVNGGHFRSMCEESGDFEELFEMARLNAKRCGLIL
ncbi:P-loop containing nucleoside triphosphate hydrolase protein [Cladochytrium replicatum]|nr:P-loop containing nucleoside triphosphate hydrolase protein [Cladochytrium replicatum]